MKASILKYFCCGNEFNFFYLFDKFVVVVVVVVVVVLTIRRWWCDGGGGAAGGKSTSTASHLSRSQNISSKCKYTFAMY